MTPCGNCGLQIRHQGDEEGVCKPCQELAQGEPQVYVSPLSREDLELILAWRSHPKIYRHFRNQTEPLSWSEHISWFGSREATQKDFLIHYGGRRVGVIGLNSRDEITIYIGEFSAQGKGIATAVINWVNERFGNRVPFFAEVSAENISSQHLFQRCGFREVDRSDGWIKYTHKYNT